MRGSFVVSGTYWGAAGFLRDGDRPWFTEDDVRFLASLSEPIAEAFRSALLTAWVTTEYPSDYGHVVVVIYENCQTVLISTVDKRR